MRILYSVRVENGAEHRAQFVVQLDDVAPGAIDIVFPSWVPGSYALRPIARNVRGLRAAARSSGTPIPTERIDKGRWRLPVGSEPSVRIEYTVYGHELITEALDITDTHLFVNAAVCLPYFEGYKDQECDIEVHVQPDWKILTELREVERVPPTFRARNYDDLVDCPIDCGTPEVLPIAPLGIPHRIVLCGKGGNYEAHRLGADLTKIVEATGKLFGELPNERYTFFFHLTDRGRAGGLEHKSSTAIVVPRTAFRPESDYVSFLHLSSHEYFHRYNVKRIRPKVLGPFDYTRENYTHLLWAMEGTTDYYAGLILRRAGITTATKYLEEVGKAISRYLEIPGRLVTSLEEASYITWIDLYAPNEDSVNQTISYYLKGGLVSLCLDLEIRHRTENRSSLDAVYRTLWTEYGAREKGLGEDEILSVVQRVTGLDMSEFFRKYVSGTDEVDFAAFAKHAGLSFGPSEEKKEEPGDDPPAGYLGIDFENSNGNARVKAVRVGSPGHRAGLSPSDEIVALDKNRVIFDNFMKELKRYPAGSEVELSFFRRGYLTTLPVTTGKAPPEKLVFTPVDDPSPLARTIYESWLETPWTPPKPRPKDPPAT